MADERSYDDVNLAGVAKALSDRYRVDVTANDLTTVKIISRNSAVQVTLQDTKPSCKYKQLGNAIESKGSNKRGEKLYANFALTNRRNSFLYLQRESLRN